jgi:microcystin-dependent protein
VFISVVATNPATLLGYGTWVAFAAGRVLVGLDAGQTEFDTVRETGGAKTHTLTTAEMPAHVHDEFQNSATTGGLAGWGARDTSTNTAVITDYDTGSAGGGGAHNNLQPYIVVHIWERTA